MNYYDVCEGKLAYEDQAIAEVVVHVVHKLGYKKELLPLQEMTFKKFLLEYVK